MGVGVGLPIAVAVMVLTDSCPNTTLGATSRTMNRPMLRTLEHPACFSCNLTISAGTPNGPTSPS